MNHEEYVKAVVEEHYPKEPTVPLPFNFTDDRGVIQNLLFAPINSVGLITTKSGGVRSNHYHKLGSHYLYVVSGRIKYSERHINGSNIIHREYGPGEMVFSGPQKVHRLEALEDCVMISMSSADKNHDNHEADLVRVEF